MTKKIIVALLCILAIITGIYVGCNSTEEYVEPTTTTSVATTVINATTVEHTTKKAKKTTTKKATTTKKYNVINCKITHYCPCATCNGSSSGLTAMGTKLKPYYTIAVDKNVIPLGSKVVINGKEYVAEDTGVSGNTIDICVSSHTEAYDKGVYYADVKIF